ncbi:MAG: HNH endonuclease [Pirellulales bacterium]|nr:HNH endonuclease [Pirellulales bacterium]
MLPFVYPDKVHLRKHGPNGYAKYDSYRPWLRDEFSFRCVYCLVREQWGRVKALFDIDHFVPQRSDPSQETVYDNLLYSCRTCNAAKGVEPIPDPCTALLSGATAHLYVSQESPSPDYS